MTNPPVEHVLVVPALLFRELGYFQGFNPNVRPYLKTLFDPAFTKYLARPEAEADPNFKQLIPYCIFRHEGRIFHYRRGKGQGEARLLSKRSVGIGGHICSEDQIRPDAPYHEAMRREIEEEVQVETTFTEELVGLINDDETEVGKVHLGIVHIFDVEAPKVLPREKSIIEAGFATPAELLADLDSFESWSQICLKALFA